MKERPILMSPPMVRAILNGTKTQTRRIIKEQPNISPMLEAEMRQYLIGTPNENCTVGQLLTGAWNAGEGPDCHLGQYRDRLWVKESWHVQHCDFDLRFPHNSRMVIDGRYKAEGAPFSELLTEEETSKFDRWRRSHGDHPSIFMFRSLSRITLEIESVRVERLNDISEEDAKAEGAGRCFIDRDHPDFAPGKLHARKDDFQLIWEAINGPGSWAANPWVWVVTFKRL